MSRIPPLGICTLRMQTERKLSACLQRLANADQRRTTRGGLFLLAERPYAVEAAQGLITSTPAASKALVSRVATANPFDAAIAAI